MNPLLIVIPFCAGDAPMADLLLSLIYSMIGKVKSGHCLLMHDFDVHEEMVNKVRIAAEVSFDTVMIRGVAAKNITGKPERINNIFKASARIVQSSFRWPWLWVEPDCVPVSGTWIDSIANAYASQPKRYMGNFLQSKTRGVCLSRISVYPCDAYPDIEKFCDSNMIFNLFGASQLVSMATKTTLIQNGIYDPDVSNLREDAVLFHGDKTGVLAHKMFEVQTPKITKIDPEIVPVQVRKKQAKKELESTWK